MPSVTLEQLSALRGKSVVDVNGEKIGEVNEVFYEEDTKTPVWIEVKRGLLKLDEVLVPAEGAMVQDVELHVPFEKKVVESAPDVEEMRALSPDSEQRLEQHYGVEGMSGTGRQQWDEQSTPLHVLRVWIWHE